ncbi:MAG: hypothetical protein MUP21_00135 [Dehalococcoidia bacterium]|nr:hypothetical protein [Dehalococcoidia bacterium]
MRAKDLVGMVKYGSYTDAFKDVAKQMETQQEVVVKKLKKEAQKRSAPVTSPKL